MKGSDSFATNKVVGLPGGCGLLDPTWNRVAPVQFGLALDLCLGRRVGDIYHSLDGL